MIFNYKNYLKAGITADEFVCLLKIKNKVYEDGCYQILLDKEFVKVITTLKKNQPIWEGLRLTPKGTKYLTSVVLPEVDDRAEGLLEALTNIYEQNGLPKEKLGARGKTLENINWFLSVTEYDSAEIENVVEDYVRNIDNQMYVKRLDNLIHWFPNGSAFLTKKGLENSKLYDLLRDQ